MFFSTQRILDAQKQLFLWTQRILEASRRLLWLTQRVLEALGLLFMSILDASDFFDVHSASSERVLRMQARAYVTKHDSLEPLCRYMNASRAPTPQPDPVENVLLLFQTLGSSLNSACAMFETPVD